MMGVPAPGAIGFGPSPVRGKSRFPLPAASTIAFIGGYLFLAPPRAAESPCINYILSDARANFTTTLSRGQAQRTFKALHGLEDRGACRRSLGAFERRRADRGRQDRPRARYPGDDPRRWHQRPRPRRRHKGT